LIRNELVKFENIFQSNGSAALLMNINSGEILSLVSLPDFNINKRKEIKDKRFINRITKGVYELGSIFKTFTIAGALNERIIKIDTNFEDLPKSIKCAGRKISEYDMEIPSTLSTEQILIRSGNIGSVRIAQKMGIEKTKSFLNSLNLLSKIEFDLDEIGKPLPLKWGKCKLATVSFGHGISTTPLQVATAYAIISNGGYKIKPTLVKKEKKFKKEKILSTDVSLNINSILRKIVSTKEGTANLANIEGYSVGGKTGTAQKIENGIYTNKKINTFVSIFPSSKPAYVLLVLLDEPKPNSEYVYNYRDGSGIKYKGTPFNTAGWTTVEVTGKIIEKIGPILATKYGEFY
jgi:cell division protein FtsI (penicillin-binding protein 3)